MKPYYYVYRYNDRGPKVRHATLEAAQTEAMRLCEQHPSEYFEILKCVGFARTTKAATFWMDGEEPPKSGNPSDMSNHQSSTKLPSRRYACKVCGRKGRRNNAPDERLREPVCPSCEKSLRHFD